MTTWDIRSEKGINIARYASLRPQTAFMRLLKEKDELVRPDQLSCELESEDVWRITYCGKSYVVTASSAAKP
jgi:hypothetical protein